MFASPLRRGIIHIAGRAAVCRAPHETARPGGSGAVREIKKQGAPHKGAYGKRVNGMKFSEMPYERPDLAAAFSAFDAMAQAIASAPDAAAVLAQYAAFEKLAAHLSTMATLAEVRHTIDTRDAFYEAERQFFDENSPRLADKQLEVYKAVAGQAPTALRRLKSWGRLHWKRWSWP